MLQAIIFIIQKTSSALGVWLTTPLKLADTVYIQFYDIVAFLFVLYIFIKFMKKMFKSDGKV